jgi:hypothetical protein
MSVKFISVPGLYRQQLASFLLDTDSEIKYLLLYSEIGWLPCDMVLTAPHANHVHQSVRSPSVT